MIHLCRKENNLIALEMGVVNKAVYKNVKNWCMVHLCRKENNLIALKMGSETLGSVIVNSE